MQSEIRKYIITDLVKVKCHVIAKPSPEAVWYHLDDVMAWKFFRIIHYSDVIIGAMASQITSLTLFTQPFIQTQIKENTKATRRWTLCGEFSGDRWIPCTNDQ